MYNFEMTSSHYLWDDQTNFGYRFTIYMIFLIQNLTTMGPVLSEIVNLIKIRDDRQMDRRTDRQTDRRKRETYFFILQGS